MIRTLVQELVNKRVKERRTVHELFVFSIHGYFFLDEKKNRQLLVLSKLLKDKISDRFFSQT